MRPRTLGLQGVYFDALCCLLSVSFLFSDYNACGSENTRIFEPDRLLEISIQLPAEDWKALRTQTKGGESNYTYFKSDITVDGITIPSVGIRKKGGFGSVVSTRPSLKINFKEYVKGQRFLGQSHLTLNNNNQDTSRLHQILAYKIFRDAGVVAPRCNLARVIVNGEDLGIYSNVESIKKPFLNRHFSNSNGHLYEGQNSDFRKGNTRFERKNNESIIHRTDISAMAELMDSDNEAFLDRLEGFLDIDAFMRFWATEVLIGHWDGYTLQRNNFYLYRNPDSKKFYFIPWGTDSAFGDTNPIKTDTTLASVYAGSVLSRRLYEQPESQAKYRAVMGRMLDDAWNAEELLHDVDRLEDMISEHVILPAPVFSKSLNKMRAYIATKGKLVQKEISQTPAPTYPPRQPYDGWLAKKVLLKGTFHTSWRDLPTLNSENGESKFKISIGGQEIEFTETGATAGLSLESLRSEYPSVQLQARRQDNDSLLIANIAIDPFLWNSDVSLPIDWLRIYAAILEAPAGGGTENLRLKGMLRGTLKLNNASRVQGETVSGSIEAHWP